MKKSLQPLPLDDFARLPKETKYQHLLLNGHYLGFTQKDYYIGLEGKTKHKAFSLYDFYVVVVAGPGVFRISCRHRQPDLGITTLESLRRKMDPADTDSCNFFEPL